MTTRTPPKSPTTRFEWQPDTWKSGEVSREHDWTGSASGAAASWPDSASGAASRMLPATVLNTVFWRLAMTPRWVEMAPLGLPVVPLV